MKKSLTNSPAAEAKTLREFLYYRVENLPRGLKLETLRDIAAACKRDEWENATTAKTPEQRRAARALTRIVAAANADLADATETLYNVFDVFFPNSTAVVLLDTFKPAQLPALIREFSVAMGAAR